MSLSSPFSVLYVVLFEVWNLSKMRRMINKRLLQYVVSKDNCEIKVDTKSSKCMEEQGKDRRLNQWAQTHGDQPNLIHAVTKGNT